MFPFLSLIETTDSADDTDEKTRQRKRIENSSLNYFSPSPLLPRSPHPLTFP